MADRIDIGLGPRLGTAPTDTSGFQFTGQTPISRQEYLSRPVDFTSEFLDTATLGQQTGIDVGAPEVGQDIAPVNVRDEQDQNDDDIPDILQGNLVSGDGKSREIVVGLDAISGGTQYATYSDYLRNKGMADRVDIGKVESLYEPIASGKFGDIDLEKFGTEVKQDVEAIPSEVQTGLEKLSTPKGRAEIGEKAAQGLIGLAGGPLGAIAASFIGGVGVRNAFGQTSFRPSGLFGAVADMVHSRQYQDMAQIRAAESAARTDIDFAAARPDTGFAIRFGNFGLTRAPGARSYTGNMQGMSLEQVKELEALSKGYLPNTYQFDTSKKENIFGGKANVTVEESGGAYSDPNNKLKGFYTADGKYYTPGVGYSRYGNAADRNRLAATNGFTENEMQDIIEDARAGKGNLADLIQQEKDNRAAETAAAKAEQERLAEIERNRQEQARIENAYNNYGGGQDDEGPSGGYDFGDTGQTGATGGTADYGGALSGARGFADGGKVGMAAGGAMAANMNSGFIGAPPSQVSEEKTVADDQLTEYPEGTFIINAAAVEFAGEKDIVKMLNDAQKEAVRRGIVLDNSEKGAKLIDVAVSQGEVKVAPYLAKIIGYDRLNKINNRGKPEVAERQREASSGGFI